ncbi:hypothetical protein B1987_18540 [Mycobacterium kansasii]|nr:hypothetical protein B1987_18540 [Mycobacterium kansasii]
MRQRTIGASRSSEPNRAAILATATAVPADGVPSDQARAINSIAVSSWLIQPFSAPTGLGW